MAGIRTALTNLVALQESVSITDPVNMSIRKAYTHHPGKSVNPGMPFIFNTWTFPAQDLAISQEVHRYTINMQVHVEDADGERAGDIASAFHEALLNAWRADPKLTQNGSPGVIGAALRGGEPTLVNFEHNGKLYTGLDLFLDCQIERT